ncbi:MAG: hypothetical protein KAI66_08610 [Lentisphaeria bacterium]|nr:hypothetical protein [Lentisphaeria bacterium]
MARTKLLVISCVLAALGCISTGVAGEDDGGIKKKLKLPEWSFERREGWVEKSVTSLKKAGWSVNVAADGDALFYIADGRLHLTDNTPGRPVVSYEFGRVRRGRMTFSGGNAGLSTRGGTLMLQEGKKTLFSVSLIDSRGTLSHGPGKDASTEYTGSWRRRPEPHVLAWEVKSDGVEGKVWLYYKGKAVAEGKPFLADGTPDTLTLTAGFGSAVNRTLLLGDLRIENVPAGSPLVVVNTDSPKKQKPKQVTPAPRSAGASETKREAVKEMTPLKPISYENIRHAYWRGEDAALLFTVGNTTNAAIEGAELLLNVAGVVEDRARFARIETGGRATYLLRVNTLLLKAGEYSVSCKFTDGDKQLAEAEFPFWVARRWNPDRMRVWLWPHTKFGVKGEKLDDEAKKQLHWYADKGFNSFIPYGKLDKDKFEVFDYALRNGWEMGFFANGGFGELLGDPETQYQIRKGKIVNDPFHPRVARRHDEANREIMRTIRQFPGVKTCFLNSEIEDRLTEVPSALKRRADVMGPTAEHKFVAPGVIADTDAGYQERLYRYKWSDGLAVVNERAARMVHRFRPDIQVFNDPHRRTATYDRFRGLDLISTWTYTNPDPKYMLFIETLIATGRPFSQGVMHTVTMLNYAGTLAPKDKGWTLMGPDRAVETNWINLSRRPDALGIYLSSACDPFDEQEEEPYQKYPRTFAALKEFTDKVVRPYGPMVRRLERTPRRAAVLSSQSSRVYSASPNLLGYYANYQIYCFYSLLSMVHIPADVVFDETIAENGLDKYDTLFLPKCDTLTETVHQRILEFAARGGHVFADQYLRADIPGVQTFDFDFTHRTKVSANAIISNVDYAKWDDHLDANTAELEQVKGVTALDDQRIMESYAARLRQGIKGKVRRNVDCSSPDALLNMLEKGQARYLFIVNDKRTYGERFGKYKAMLEKAVPQTVTITLNEWPHSELFVYDLIGRRVLPHEKKAGGAIQFQVDLPAPGGRIIVLLPRKLASIEILAPPRISSRGERHNISILLRDPNGHLVPGVQPVEVRVLDPEGAISELSDYYATESGTLSLDFIPAVNDLAGRWTIEVEELMTGMQHKTTFELTRPGK